VYERAGGGCGAEGGWVGGLFVRSHEGYMSGDVGVVGRMRLRGAAGWDSGGQEDSCRGRRALSVWLLGSCGASRGVEGPGVR